LLLDRRVDDFDDLEDFDVEDLDLVDLDLADLVLEDLDDFKIDREVDVLDFFIFFIYFSNFLFLFLLLFWQLLRRIYLFS